MEFSNKKLQKAFEYYEQGKYKEALKICSKVLNKEYNNEDALTLEGEVLFKSGRIDDAIITWKINAEYNNNELAKKHLARIDNGVKEMALSYTSIYSEDEEYKRLIIDAYKESKKDDEPVKDQLKDSTLNKSKVEDKKDDSTLSSKESIIKEKVEEKPVVKKEEPKAKNTDSTFKETTAKVTPIKKEIVESKTINNKKELSNKETSSNKNKISKEKVSSIKKDVTEEKVIPIKKDKKAVVEEKVIPIKKEVAKEEVKKDLVKEAIKKDVDKKTDPTIEVLKRNSSDEVTKTRVEKHCNSKNSFNKKIVAIIVAAVIVVGGGIAIYKSNASKPAPQKPIVEQPKIDWTGFNTNVKSAISNQNFSELYTLLTKAPEKEVPQDEQAAYQNGLQAMDQDGIQYFYDQGMNYYNQQQYKQAIDSFQKGLKFAQNNYLAPHLTYYIGASYSGLGNHAEAVEYYKLYLKNFPNDNIYNSGCLYVLAKYYYAQGHVKEAQSYASQLQDKYPNSPYNNTDISNILNNK